VSYFALKEESYPNRIVGTHLTELDLRFSASNSYVETFLYLTSAHLPIRDPLSQGRLN